MVLAEHGVYVRESYLAAARSGGSPGARFTATRLARGLTRVAYEGADMVAPVSDANAYWEMGLGVDAAKILVLYNGLARPPSPAPPPRNRTVVVMGRIDPLKDVHTTLRVAAETLELVPGARFLHYGPVTDGEEAYGRSCHSLHEQLGLGDRFAFMGRTTDPLGAVRDADVFLMTSISEGLPMSILEAMGQGRPVVATGVGGVPDVVRGCGLVTPPGDVHGLARAVTTLLDRPALAWQLGRRGHDRLGRVFDEDVCVDGYRSLLLGLASRGERAERRSGPVPVAA
jgi:glycosyltransferase involved in cell wall biosynthesis